MKRNESTLIKEAKQLIEVLPSLTKLPPELRGKTLATLLTEYVGQSEEVARQESALAEAIDKRNESATHIADLGVRIRAAVRGIYGADAREYEKVGGTRKSDRKKRVRKTRVIAAPAPAAAGAAAAAAPAPPVAAPAAALPGNA